MLSVAESDVFTNEQCEAIDGPEGVLRLVSQAHLPYGTMLWADDDLAACLLPQPTSNPLTKVGILAFATGEVATVLDSAIGAQEGFQIYDVRANSHGAVWTEADILNGTWRVYTARLAGSSGAPAGGTTGTAASSASWSLESPALAAEGNSAWEMPYIAVAGDYAFWQLMPERKGSAKSQDSAIMRIPFGGASEEAKAVLETDGRMACALTGNSNGITAAPRIVGDTSHYQIVHIDASSGIVDDYIVLPSSMKPTYIAYGDTGFSFAFEGIYSNGDGISNLGTYTPTGQNDSGWFRYSRTPYTAPAWCGPWFLVKSTNVVAAVDLKGRKIFSLEPEHVTQGYGEFLASSGSGKRFATYSNIDYTPLNGQRINECNVRVWETA